jgi:hypothetical protein
MVSERQLKGLAGLMGDAAMTRCKRRNHTRPINAAASIVDSARGLPLILVHRILPTALKNRAPTHRGVEEVAWK